MVSQRDIRIDNSRTQGGISRLGATKPSGETYSFQPNDTFPKGTVGSSTGIFTTGGQKVGAGAVAAQPTERTVVKDGRTYTYRNGKLVNVSQGYQDVNARNEFAATQQAAKDFAAQNPDTSGADLSTGGGVPKGVQTLTDALIARLQGGGYGSQYQPAIDTLQGLLEADKASLASQGYMAPVTALQGQLDKMYGLSQKGITDANAALLNYLTANMSNPFANVQAQTATLQPGFADLLATQGVSGEPIANEAAAAREAAQTAGGQFQNLLNVMSSLQSAGLGSLKNEAALQNQYANQALEAQKAAYGQQLLGQGEALRKDLADQIRKNTTDISALLGQKSSAKETLQGQLIDLIAKGGKVSPSVMKDIFGTDVTSETKGSTEYGSFKEALKAMHPNFKGTVADAKKKFPKLAASFSPKKK
jgi:hypothetical protein